MSSFNQDDTGTLAKQINVVDFTKLEQRLRAKDKSIEIKLEKLNITSIEDNCILISCCSKLENNIIIISGCIELEDNLIAALIIIVCTKK